MIEEGKRKMGRIYLDKTTGKLERTDIYRVRLVLSNGDVIDGLEPRRLFPFSNSRAYITLLDENEKEIALIRNIADLDTDSAGVLDACFAEYYLIPQITRLVESIEKFGSLKWHVETDRGEVTFRIRNRHNDIKLFRGTNRVLVRDSNDNRYEIKDYTQMDAHSRSVLFSFL